MTLLKVATMKLGRISIKRSLKSLQNHASFPGGMRVLQTAISLSTITFHPPYLPESLNICLATSWNEIF
jgi:hypothetical protein